MAGGMSVPAVLDLELSVPAGTQVYPARLHGAVCAMLEDNSVAHSAQHKPFSVGRFVEDSSSRVQWRVGWLAAAEPPHISEVIVLCPARCAVRHAEPQLASFAELLAAQPVRHVELRFVSPTFFARKGRDLPLPDPVLVMRSLASRWDAHAPSVLTLPAKELSALLDSVYLDEVTVESRRAQVSGTMWQPVSSVPRAWHSPERATTWQPRCSPHWPGLPNSLVSVPRLLTGSAQSASSRRRRVTNEEQEGRHREVKPCRVYRSFG